ncbi:MAG: response regulator [Bacteroidota bacterium]
MTDLPRHILVVEDEDDIRGLVRLTLELSGGFQVSECASGDEAVQCVDDIQPDLLLLDVMMPGLDGPATMQQIHAAQTTPTPVIFLTARAQQHEVAAYKAAGARGVITKPFNPITLVADIERIWQSDSQTA